MGVVVVTESTILKIRVSVVQFILATIKINA